jgi:hypothetical protein
MRRTRDGTGACGQKVPPYWTYAPEGAEGPARRQCAAPEPEKVRLLSRKKFRFGIGPRRPAKQPWLAAGVSRSTWYRRRKRAREAAAVAYACAAFDRAESLAAELTCDLAR